MPQIKQMGPTTGDEVIMEWDENDPEAVKKAEKRIKKMLETEGLKVYRVETHLLKRTGEEIGSIEEFQADKDYLGAPAMAGG